MTCSIIKDESAFYKIFTLKVSCRLDSCTVSYQNEIKNYLSMIIFQLEANQSDEPCALSKENKLH